ncbi:vitamin D-binding -like protein [Labeo rohita]|uniref:Vitamin D-binding protein n=1 Tax=Labeo rohita TaxID=84645 RepID=A0A498LYY3_LABRO|nr:vitamin D-binding -like protein [Labeo rohita]
MRSTALILISALIVPALLALKGKNYTKENVCQELKAFGIETVTVLYSQKFPNGTFQEVNCVADEMTKLAEKCCKDDASPDCYDKGATEISEKSCGKDSPFPKHPGIEQCCTLQGHEKKLCLASLRYSADELPSLLEPTNEEICTEYTKNEKDYAVRYLFLIGVNHPSISLPVLTTVLDRIKNTATACCSSADITACLTEKESKLKKTTALLSKLDVTCSQYFSVDLPAFKTLMQKEVQREEGEKRTQAWVDLATSCCSRHPPAQLCQKLFALLAHEACGICSAIVLGSCMNNLYWEHNIHGWQDVSIKTEQTVLRIKDSSLSATAHV